MNFPRRLDFFLRGKYNIMTDYFFDGFVVPMKLSFCSTDSVESEIKE